MGAKVHNVPEGLRRVVAAAALLNLTYFFVEFWVANHIRSASLFADSVDFLEDAAVNSLLFISVGWSLRRRSTLGMVLAGILLIPSLAFVWTVWRKFQAPEPPEPWLLSATGCGALAVNVGCALLLARFRHHSGSLTRAAFLSARNDAVANIAIMSAGFATLRWSSIWPDLGVGLGIALMNVDAAKDVWRAARAERLSPEP
jgi:Co/Zn/Cd efflux system component